MPFTSSILNPIFFNPFSKELNPLASINHSGCFGKPGFPNQPDWFIDARGFNSLETGLKKIGFNLEEVNDILGNNWFNFYKGIN